MNQPSRRDIVVEEVFSHVPRVIWKTLTTGALMERWLRMTPSGFEPIVGNRFTYQTTPAGGWDGVIHCEVLEVVPDRCFVYSWKGGHSCNDGKYGSALDTVVTFTLEVVDDGTRLRVTHAGFIVPHNDTAYRGMSQGWVQVVKTIGAIVDEDAS
jgi:uncharacterized protein YndB with AHSA1/START domain